MGMGRAKSSGFEVENRRKNGNFGILENVQKVGWTSQMRAGTRGCINV
jgi:predicted NUDIX family NTP pyrophosphohydrolase